MRYVSTRGEAPPLGFMDVTLAGLARDGGLYVPEAWPVRSDDSRAARVAEGEGARGRALPRLRRHHATRRLVPRLPELRQHQRLLVS